MSVKHLHLVQCTYQSLPNCLQDLTQIYQEQDFICLLEDAVLAIYDAHIQQFAKVLLLKDDANQIDPSYLNQSQIEIIEYTDLAHYIAQADKVITWR